jgi:hypothetical protein
MTLSRLNLLLGLATLTLFTCLTATVLADQTRVRLETDLTPTAAAPDAEGHARFESRPDRARFRVEVEDVSVTDAVDVLVNGNLIGVITLDNGFGELELNSKDGDTVPLLQAGDEVDIVDDADGTTLLLSGVLSPK